MKPPQVDFSLSPPTWRARRQGQGVVEYAGAMIVAALIVASLATAMQQGNWMYNSYNNIMNAAGNMLLTELGNL